MMNSKPIGPRHRAAAGAAVLLLCAGFAAPALAEAPARASAIELGVFGGYTLLSADNQLGNAPNPARRPGSGALFGARGGWNLSDALTLEAEVDYGLSTFRDSGLAAGLVGWRGSLLWQFGSVGGAGGPGGEARWRPFVLAGAGGTATLWREFGTEHDHDITAHAGVGVSADLGPRFGVRLDLRGFALDGDQSRIAWNGAVLLGVWVRLGAADAAQLPPPPPAPRPEPPPPPKPLDSDGDGIADDVDQCRDQKGSAEDHGCPPPDADGDGIPDRRDRCPAEKETFNGKDDDDGCPDGTETVVVTATEVKILQKVHFEPGKAEIRAESHALLDAVANVLTQKTSLTKVAVEGHTDDVGAAEANVALSRQRAEAVVAYLVGKGIAATRLSAEGYGPDRPVCKELAALRKDEVKNKGKIEQCREQNRRVQFRVVESN
ncbi:MAG: OmpA family protein [Deltaproteobacteria bacterium]|nr:OmpA family protein [Deltaproteobacteria bacterium]